MNVTGDRTTPHGLATMAIDDEGVAAQSFDLVRDGVLVGYQLDRRIAAVAVSGARTAAPSPTRRCTSPIQRMANVSLAPAAGVGPPPRSSSPASSDGIYIVGDKSWSIDMQRYNFQFTGQRFFRIEHGRLAGQLQRRRLPGHHHRLLGRRRGRGWKSTYLLGGAFNCGKGQPGQVAPVSHGCPPALVRDVNVLNTREEAGR